MPGTSKQGLNLELHCKLNAPYNIYADPNFRAGFDSDLENRDPMNNRILHRRGHRHPSLLLPAGCQRHRSRESSYSYNDRCSGE